VKKGETSDKILLAQRLWWELSIKKNKKPRQAPQSAGRGCRSILSLSVIIFPGLTASHAAAAVPVPLTFTVTEDSSGSLDGNIKLSVKKRTFRVQLAPCQPIVVSCVIWIWTL